MISLPHKEKGETVNIKMWKAVLFSAGLAALVWVTRFLIAGHVPVQGLRWGHFAVSMSRWWDIPIVPLFSALLFGYFTHPKVKEMHGRDEGILVGTIGAGFIVAVFGWMFATLGPTIRGPNPYGPIIGGPVSALDLMICPACGILIYVLLTAFFNSSKALKMMLGCGLIGGLVLGIGFGLCFGLAFSLIWSLTIYLTHQTTLFLRPSAKQTTEGTAM